MQTTTVILKTACVPEAAQCIKRVITGVGEDGEGTVLCCAVLCLVVVLCY